MQELFASILRHIPDDKEEFTPEDAAKITNEIIEQEIGIWDAASKRGTKYRAVVDKTRSTAAVNNGQQRILYPGKRSAGNYSRIELEKIIVHCINSDLSACRCGLRRWSKKSRGARRSEGRRGKSAAGGHQRKLPAL